MSLSTSSTSAVASSPLLTPDIVNELRINIIKKVFPLSEIPETKRKIANPTIITEVFTWEVDGFWFDNFTYFVRDQLKTPRLTSDNTPKTVSVTTDCDVLLLKSTTGAIELSSNCRFMLQHGHPFRRQSAPSLIYIRPSNLALLKDRKEGAEELTVDHYNQGLLAAMAARFKPNTLVQVLCPAENSDLVNHGMPAVEGNRAVGYFVRTALKVPTGGWKDRHTNHPNGTDAYEEILDFNQLSVLNHFLLQLLEMAPGPMKTPSGGVGSLGSIGSRGSQYWLDSPCQGPCVVWTVGGLY